MSVALDGNERRFPEATVQHTRHICIQRASDPVLSIASVMR